MRIVADQLAEDADQVADGWHATRSPNPEMLRAWARWLRALPDDDVRIAQLEALTEHVWDNEPGRWLTSFRGGEADFEWLLERIIDDAVTGAVVDLELDLEEGP